MDGDESEVYGAPAYQAPNQNKFSAWFLNVFTHRKVLYVGATLLMLGLSWWTKNWFAPGFFIIVFMAIRGVVKWLSKTDYVFILEGRMQGEWIKHCAYYQAPFKVPNSWLRMHMIRKARMQDPNTFIYGDANQPVQTSNIVTCDFYQELPNGHVIIVHPVSRNFGNVALYTRMTPDAIKAQETLGLKREVNLQSREFLLEMYHSGRLGTGQVAYDRLKAALLTSERLETAFGNSDIALRKVWLFNKETIPKLIERDVMSQQLMGQKAMAMAAKFAHESFGAHITEDQMARLDAILAAEPEDFDSRVRSLVKKGDREYESGDVSRVNRSPIENQPLIGRGT